MPDHACSVLKDIVTAISGECLNSRDAPFRVKPGEFARPTLGSGAVVQHDSDLASDTCNGIHVSVNGAFLTPAHRRKRRTDINFRAIQRVAPNDLICGVHDTNQIIDHRKLMALVIEPPRDHPRVGNLSLHKRNRNDTPPRTGAMRLCARFECKYRVTMLTQAEEETMGNLQRPSAIHCIETIPARNQTIKSLQICRGKSNPVCIIGLARQRCTYRAEPSSFNVHRGGDKLWRRPVKHRGSN